LLVAVLAKADEEDAVGCCGGHSRQLG